MLGAGAVEGEGREGWQGGEERFTWRENSSTGIFKQSMGARNRVGKGCRTGLPGYIGWRNQFLGIDSWAP